VFNVGSAIDIYHDADGSSFTYTAGAAWTYLGASDLDGKPGLELRINAGGRTRVINDRLRTIT
jgi:hypothetical protein